MCDIYVRIVNLQGNYDVVSLFELPQLEYRLMDIHL
jgi:hypothetical protein